MMKRCFALVLAVCLVWGLTCAGAEGLSSRIEQKAVANYSENWNRYFRESGLPYELQPELTETGLFCLTLHAQAERSYLTMEEWFSAPELLGDVSIMYDSDSHCFLLAMPGGMLLDAPQSLELYAGSRSWQAAVERTQGSEYTGEIYTVSLPFESVAACLSEQNGFMRLVTDRGTSFQELNETETPTLCAMLTVLYEGICYSDRQSSSYLSSGLLPETAPAATATVAPEATPSGIAFQNDYEAIAEAAQSVFLLMAYDENDIAFASGSGFLAFDGQTMITNHHVIDGAAYMVACSDNYEATYLLTDLKAVREEWDIAILHFNSEGKRIPPLALDSSSRLLRGQPVTAIGSPEGVLNTVSSGTISNIPYYNDVLPDVIQFTAAISHGSSGGALFNEKGSVIGLVFSGMEEADNMNYAVPIKYVEQLYRESAGNAAVPLTVYNKLIDQLPKASMQAPRAVDGGVLLTWTKVEGAEEYRVYRKHRDDADFREIATTTQASCTDKTAEPGQSYTYRVEAVHSWKLPSTSNQVAITVPVPTPTPTPKPTPKPTATPVPQGQLILSKDDRGEDVLALRLMLYELGYHGLYELDNEVYSPQLCSVVKTFQDKHQLQGTGALDEHTLAKLSSGDALPGQLSVPAGLTALSRRHYKEGDTGEDISRLKARMMALGYYRPNAKYDDTYNATMTSRVKQLQTNNKLTATGELDHRTLIALYSDKCKTGEWYTPPETGKGYTPPEVSGIKLVIPNNGYGEWENGSGNTLKFRLQLKNISQTKTVSSYEIYLYPVNAKGQRLIASDKVYILTGSNDIKPGKTAYTPFITLANANRIAGIHAAVHKVKYTDGSTDTVTNHDYFTWDID